MGNVIASLLPPNDRRRGGANPDQLSIWRSISVVGLTWVVIFVLAPLAAFLALGYLLAG